MIQDELTSEIKAVTNQQAALKKDLRRDEVWFETKLNKTKLHSKDSKSRG